MNIIIGNKNDLRINELVRKIPNSIVTSNYCNLKNIKELCVVIIPHEIINNNGLISNTEIFIDELLLNLKVVKVVYGNINNSYMINRIRKDYHINVELMWF